MDIQIYKKKYCIVIGVILLVLMGIGSIWDYQISQFFYNSSNIFGVFLAGYGQIPALLCMAAIGTLLLRMIDKDKKIKTMLYCCLSLLFNFIAVIGITIGALLYISRMTTLLSLVIAIGIVGIVDVLIYRLSSHASQDTIKKIVIFILLTVLIEVFVVNIVKMTWERPRMRMISSRHDVSFQPWWVIGNTMKDQLMALGVAGEEFKSFSSGHTANAACAMLLCVLPLLNRKLKGKENLLFFIGVCFTFLVALSRIIMGAHFLTDVVTGMAISLVIQMIMARVIFKNYSKDKVDCNGDIGIRYK